MNSLFFLGLIGLGAVGAWAAEALDGIPPLYSSTAYVVAAALLIAGGTWATAMAFLSGSADFGIAPFCEAGRRDRAVELVFGARDESLRRVRLPIADGVASASARELPVIAGVPRWQLVLVSGSETRRITTGTDPQIALRDLEAFCHDHGVKLAVE